jgi:hypothetical protein
LVEEVQYAASVVLTLQPWPQVQPYVAALAMQLAESVSAAQVVVATGFTPQPPFQVQPSPPLLHVDEVVCAVQYAVDAGVGVHPVPSVQRHPSATPVAPWHQVWFWFTGREQVPVTAAFTLHVPLVSQVQPSAWPVVF